MKCFLSICQLLLCACLLHRSDAFGQRSDLGFDHLTVEHGLSQSTVLAITQDAEGFMWLGTREGLNRYDARNLRVYLHDSSMASSLSDNSIYSLLTDSRGRLWVGTRGGLNLYNAATDAFTRYRFHEGRPQSLSNNTVTALLEDRNKNIWVGTRYGLNLMVEKDSVTFIRIKHSTGDSTSLVNDDIRSLFQDKEGALWVGTSQGISKVVLKGDHTFTITSFNLPKPADASSGKTNWANAFAEVDDGRMMIGTERNGLTFFDKKTGVYSTEWTRNSPLHAKAVRTIMRDPFGDFWVGTIGGLFVVKHDFSSVRLLRNVHDNPASVSDNSIRSLYYDRQGSYWIGTFHGGVNIYSPISKQFRYLKPGSDVERFRFKIASALITDKQDNFWIGTEGNGLLFVDRQYKLKEHFKHDENNKNSLSHDNIKCLLLEEGQGIWIGTIKGLDFYDFRQRKFIHYKNDRSDKHSLPDDVIYDVIKDRDGKLWVATYRGGLVRLDTRARKVEEIYTHDAGAPKTISSEGITRLFMDARQNLWIGTMSGLNRMMPGGTFKRFMHHAADASSISGNYIMCLHEDKHHLWVGTRGAGLNMLTTEGVVVRHFSVADGLPGNTIYGIQEDGKGYLWLSTENGLSRLDKKNFSFKNFNNSDGLICKEFNFNSYHKDRAGYLYFGGYNGVVYFHPDSISENKAIPALAFTGMRLFNKEVKVGDQHGVLQNHINHQTAVQLRHDQNIFSLEFAVLNFINARKNQFAYKLAGFENDWNIVDEPLATYMNLAPGTYTLMVKGANNDGVWNTEPRMLTISVLPPPWKTWWAYSAYLSVFFLLLYAWARLNKKRVKLQHDLQLEHMEKVKQEELHQAKLNFFTNIAHEIRTPVTLMAGPLDHIIDNHRNDAPLRKELSLVKSNADRLMRLLNQLLDFQKHETGNVRIRVSKGDIVAFLREMLYSFRAYAVSRNVSLTLHTAPEPVALWFDRDELSKVFFNLLVNALKFTPGGGQVNIMITYAADEAMVNGSAAGEPPVKIVIEDNGLGIPTSHLEKIFHRFYQAETTGIQEAGFGIGLALTKGIIDLHHGTISAESREATPDGSGFTRFVIMLPRGNSHFNGDQLVCEEERLMSCEPLVPVTAETPPQKTETGEKPLLLLVEDNDDIRRYLAHILMPQYEILESSNGSQGFDIAVERLPNLIVSDVMMPLMNGIDLVRQLKHDVRTNHIPVILLTARGTLNHQVEGLETGADDYLTKPFNISLLQAKIKNHLQVREKLKEKYSRMVTLQPLHEEVEDPDDKFLQRLMRILEENIMDAEFNVSSLVREIGMSRPVLFRKTKMLTGLSVIDLIRNVRLKKAEMLLKQKKLSISEVAFTVGFSDPKYFSKSFRNQFGKPPSQYLDELE